MSREDRNQPPGGRPGASFTSLANKIKQGEIMPTDLDWSTISRTGIPIGVLMLMIAAAGPAVTWFVDYHSLFITAAQANETIELKLHDLEEKVDQNTVTLTEFQREVRIGAALQRVEYLEGRLYVLQRDGADPDLVHEIEADYGRATQYADCLVDGRPHCKHLEPGRTR